MDGDFFSNKMGASVALLQAVRFLGMWEGDHIFRGIMERKM
jgi:hypothetical protein